jgi:hypothetical protein
MTRILILLLCIGLRCFAADAWPGVPYSEVRAYAWPDDKQTEAVILEGMALKPGVINPEGNVLTAEQTQALIKAVIGKHPKYPVAACHIPHNAFVLYDAAKKPVAYVEICFGCHSLSTFPPSTASYVDLLALAAIFDAQKLPMGEYPNLAAFKKKFEALQKRVK